MKILIAEDDLFLGKFYAKKLSQKGHSVLHLKCGKEMLEMAKKEKPNVILLDMIMPEKDGFQVLSELHSDPEVAKIPVVALTSLSAEEDVAKIKKLGAVQYFDKDAVTFDVVIKFIEQL